MFMVTVSVCLLMVWFVCVSCWICFDDWICLVAFIVVVDLVSLFRLLCELLLLFCLLVFFVAVVCNFGLFAMRYTLLNWCDCVVWFGVVALEWLCTV